MAGLLDNLPGAGSLDQRAGLLDRLSAGERVSPEERAAVDASSQTSLNEFQKGLRRFGYSTLATSQAFAGQMLQPVAPQLGQGLINEGQATVRAMPRTIQPEFESFDQAQAAGLRGLGSYAASALGEGLPSTALMLGAGLAGRGAATLARATPAARAAAQYGAGMGTMVPLEGGETALQLNQDPQALANTTPAERAALTLGRGVTNAALENIVPQALLMPRLLGQAGRIAPGVGPAVGNVLRTGAAGAIGEYGTEAAQDLTGQAALNFARRDPLTNFDLSQANEAGIRGAITGGVTGGLGGAVQGVYSNIGAGADAVTDAVKSRLPNLPGLPSMDSVVGRFTQMVNRPQEFGADMANMTLDGIDAAARNAGPAFTAGRQAVGRGLEQAESGVGWLKQQVDSYIVRNIAPEKRAEFAEVSARLGTLNPAAWQTFKNALQREGNEEFRTDLGASARMFGRGAVEGAKGTWNWLKDVGTGVSDAVRARRDAKQSFIIRQYSEDARNDLKTLLKNGDPETYNVFRKASIKEQRQLADILLSARDDPGYFAATDSKGRLLRQNVIDGWQQSTGTDIRETIDKLNSWRNASVEGLANIMAGRDGDPNKVMERMEREMPGATDKESLLSEDNLRRATPKLTEESDRPTFDESGNVMDEDKPYTTPFDLKTFQDSLAATNFDKDNPARGGVEVKLVADGIKPSELAQLVGKKESVKTGGKWQGQTSPYSEQELAQFDKDGAVTTRVNLMSLWGAAQNEANRAKFAEFIDAYDSERTTDERAGDAGFTLLAQLGSDGFKIPLADGREVSVQVQLPENAEQSISGDMVIRRAGQGKKPYTYADYRGDSRRALSREKQLALLTEDQTPENLRALADGGNKTAERIGKILYARAAGASEIGRPTGQQLAVELKKYRAELTEKIQSTETSKRVQRDVEILREALINGVLSQSDIEALARYYTKVDERGDSITDGIADPQEREAERGRVFAIAKRVMSSVGARKGNKLMSREGPGAAMLGRQLRAMAADVDLRQEDFFDSITGRNAGNPSDSADQEFLANMQEPQQRANTARAAALMRDIDRGIKPAAPAPASTQNVRVQRLPYVGPDAPPLLQRVTKAIAEAKTLEALQKIGNTLGLFTSRMPEAEVKSLRNQYAAKQRDLRGRSALGRTATQPGVNAADATKQRDLSGRSALDRIATQLGVNAADITSVAADEASGRAGLDFGPDINVVITTRDGKSVTALVNNEDQTNAQRYLIRAQRSAADSRPREGTKQAKASAFEGQEEGPSGLEQKLAARIDAAQTKLGLMQIANTIQKTSKKALPEEARQRLRDLWKAKETALENPSAEPPKPPAPPPPTPPAPPPPAPPSSEAQKKFVEAVEKLVGKRVRVVFDAALQNGVAAEYQSREAALEQIRDERRAAQADLKIPASARDSNLTDEELRENIAKADAKEQEILNDKAILGVITVAVGMEEKAGLAEHEAFHGAFAFFFNKDPEMRRVLGLAFSEGLVGRRLREYFKGNDDVLALIDPQSKSYDPEEAAAYGFQVWMHDPSVLKLGEKAESMFARVKQFFRDLFGLLTPEQKALLVLNDLKSGRLADKGTSPLAKQLDKDRPWTERAQKYARDIGGIGMKFYDMALSSVYQRVVDFENPVLTKIAKSVYSATGEMSSAGMIQRQMAEERARRNQLAKIFADLTDDQKLQLHDAKVFDKPPSDPVLRERWDQLNAYYKDMYDYQVAAGVELNNAGIKNNYYPLTWDPEKVLKNKDAFLKMMAKYEEQLTTTRKTPDEIYEGIVAYLERGEDLVNVMGSDNEPTAEHTRTRTLAFIDREDRRPFMTDDPIATAVRYTKQAVRQAEYVRAFGMQGRLLQDMKTEARKVYGATEEEIALVDDLINGALGNKEAGMSRELKDLYGGLTVYQNIRLLPLSIFSSLVDPMGIAVRSNSIGDAWDTFTYSIKNLFKEWKKDYTPDQWETIATDWGIIERAGTTINTDALYTGVTLRGTTKKINDAFFKYNLLNGWIRNNHIMATKAAQQFMYRASEGFFKGKGQNERYLEELGVSKDDIVYNEQLGRILLKTDELVAAGKTQEEASAIEGRLRAATQKFVRQALLNPTAPELANWASNPYLAPITHLKQFVWAFNATITNRVANELENNNYKPLMLAAAYVPAMIAADFLKDMVNYAGEEPPYKKDWGVVDYVKHGINRSGFTGTGAFFVDAKEDIMRGGTGGESFAGPSLEQLKKLVQAVGAEDSAAMERWMVKALPANALYDQALMD